MLFFTKIQRDEFYHVTLHFSKFYYRSMPSCTLSHPWRFQTTVFTALIIHRSYAFYISFYPNCRLFISDRLHNLLNTRTRRLYSYSIIISSKRMYVRYNNGARRSQHILICVYHILLRLLAQWSLQRISLPATRIPCHFNHSTYCPPAIPVMRHCITRHIPLNTQSAGYLSAVRSTC